MVIRLDQYEVDSDAGAETVSMEIAGSAVDSSLVVETRRARPSGVGRHSAISRDLSVHSASVTVRRWKRRPDAFYPITNRRTASAATTSKARTAIAAASIARCIAAPRSPVLIGNDDGQRGFLVRDGYAGSVEGICERYRPVDTVPR